jgi:hypothetical protein
MQDIGKGVLVCLFLIEIGEAQLFKHSIWKKLKPIMGSNFILLTALGDRLLSAYGILTSPSLSGEGGFSLSRA